MRRFEWTKGWLSLLALIALCGVSGKAAASAIGPGFDLFATVSAETFVNLDPFIPGAGIVSLEGVPFGPADTDTIVERLQGIDPFEVCPTLPCSDTIDIELVALSLTSLDPVDVGGTFFDLEVFGGTDFAILQILGSMTIIHDDPNGGTFSSILDVNADLIFTEVGNPLNTFTVPFADTFTANGLWCHDGGPGDQHGGPYPSGDFHAGVQCLPGGGGIKVLTQEQALLAAHGVLPSMPEPSTYLLVGLGFAGLVVHQRRRLRR